MKLWASDEESGAANRTHISAFIQIFQKFPKRD
jgi:hypothetical protein